MRAAVYYHSDFAEKGYITLRHRVKPGFDGLQDLIKAGHLEVLEPVINAESRELLAGRLDVDSDGARLQCCANQSQGGNCPTESVPPHDVQHQRGRRHLRGAQRGL